MSFYNEISDTENDARRFINSSKYEDEHFDCPYYQEVDLSANACEAICESCEEKIKAFNHDYVLLADVFNQHLHDTYKVSPEDLAFLSCLIFNAGVDNLNETD